MKIKVIIALAFFLFSISSAFSADGEYAVAKIKPVLLPDAHVVKRMAETRYEVISFSKTRLYNKYAITIMNENGDRFARMYEFYDGLRSVKSIEGKLYDANGKMIKALKSKDIEDRSNVSEISLMEDSRIKTHNFYYKVYPYTVEYETVVEFNNTYMFYPWLPQPEENYAVEKSSMTVSCPSWFTFQYKMFNYNGSPVETEVKGEKNYTWQVSEMLPITKEYANPDWQFLTTCVYFKPDKFEFGGYKGSMSSWNELGLFQLQLNKGRDKLPDAVKQQVHQLTDGVSDTKEKVRILYEYLQKNTRYISIQLGIGGYQPFDAAYVAKNAYGDCKALSNYMYALLKEANINSCYVEITAGDGEQFFMPDFSTDQFNHIILCVPMVTDSIWLECTSQTLPAGYLAGFTSNRYALLVNETGGHLVRTPKYGVKENIQIRNISAILDKEGTMQITASTTFSGLQQDDYHSLINNLSKDKVKESLQAQFDFQTYDILQFEYQETKSALPVIKERLEISVSNYATITGKRLFITPNIMTRANQKIAIEKERKYEIVLGLEYTDTDSVEIELPKGYEPEAMPQDMAISSKFGSYRSSVKLLGNKLLYSRHHEQYSGRFPAKDYAELAKFYETIYNADRSRVVLVKSETNPK